MLEAPRPPRAAAAPPLPPRRGPERQARPPSGGGAQRTSQRRPPRGAPRPRPPSTAISRARRGAARAGGAATAPELGDAASGASAPTTLPSSERARRRGIGDSGPGPRRAAPDRRADASRRLCRQRSSTPATSAGRVGHGRSDRRHLALQERRVHLAEVLELERPPAGERLEEDDAHRPDVRATIDVLLAHRLLERHVVRRTEDRAGARACLPASPS